MAERYNAPLIDFDPFRNDEHENRRRVVGRFILTAVIIGLVLAGIIIFIINHQSPQDNNDSPTLTQESTLAPARAEERPDREEDALYISGIVGGGGQPIAVIGGQMLKAGDIVKDYRIKSIGSNYVEFLDKGGHMVIKEVGK